MEEVCRGAKRIAVLENVVNPTNVGAIFRSAAALGMDAVLLTRACSNPLYRRAIRVSMGTVFQVPWTFADVDWESTGVEKLHTLGFRTAALALSDDSISIEEEALRREEKLAVVLGTEGEGLLDRTIAACDYTVDPHAAWRRFLKCSCGECSCFLGTAPGRKSWISDKL